MKYEGYALVYAEVEADNEEQARVKIADKLGDDYFSWFDPEEIALVKRFDPNDFTHMFNGMTEIPKDAFKGWTVEELKKQIADMRGDKANV